MNALIHIAQCLTGTGLEAVAGGVFPIEYAILCPVPIDLPLEWPPMFPTFSWVLSV